MSSIADKRLDHWKNAEELPPMEDMILLLPLGVNGGMFSRIESSLPRGVRDELEAQPKHITVLLPRRREVAKGKELFFLLVTRSRGDPFVIINST